MNKVFLFLFLFFQVACYSSDKVDLSYKIMNSYAAKQKKERNLRLSCIGGSWPTDIHVLDVDFDTNLYVDVPQARKLIVPCIKEFLDQINSDKQIRPYLHDYPSTVKNIGLGISFSNKKTGRCITYPYIAYVFTLKGKIYYNYYSNSEAWTPLEDAHEESYEEALRIVQENKSQDSAQ